MFDTSPSLCSPYYLYHHHSTYSPSTTLTMLLLILFSSLLIVYLSLLLLFYPFSFPFSTPPPFLNQRTQCSIIKFNKNTQTTSTYPYSPSHLPSVLPPLIRSNTTPILPFHPPVLFHSTGLKSDFDITSLFTSWSTKIIQVLLENQHLTLEDILLSLCNNFANTSALPKSDHSNLSLSPRHLDHSFPFHYFFLYPGNRQLWVKSINRTRLYPELYQCLNTPTISHFNFTHLRQRLIETVESLLENDPLNNLSLYKSISSQITALLLPPFIRFSRLDSSFTLIHYRLHSSHPILDKCDIIVLTIHKWCLDNSSSSFNFDSEQNLHSLICSDSYAHPILWSPGHMSDPLFPTSSRHPICFSSPLCTSTIE